MLYMDCNFCGVKIKPGTGTLYVTKKGKAHYFCSSKCEKNHLKLKRKPRKTRWTQIYQKDKDARLKHPQSVTEDRRVDEAEEGEDLE